MHFITDACCEICGYPFELEYFQEKALCGQCLTERPPFARARAVCIYNEASSPMMTGLKFQDKTFLAPYIAGWMAKAGKPLLAEAELVIPVPLHRTRLFTRKYNQAMLLARAIARNAKLPVLPHVLARTRKTPPQTGLSQAQRRKNVAGAFTIAVKYKPLVAQKRILLVDDVLTTGATIHACTRALLKAGALRVDVLTFSRTTHDG